MSGARALEASTPAWWPKTGRRRDELVAAWPRDLLSFLLRADHVVPVRPLRDTGVDVRACVTEAPPPRVFHAVHRAPAALAEAYATQASVPIQPPTAAIGLIPQAMVAAGIVQLADGTVIAESLVNTGGDFSFTPFHRDTAGRLHRHQGRFGRVRRLNNRAYVLLKQRWDANYGHWLVEALPRIACVQDHFSLSELGFIVSAHHGSMQPIYEQSLALFGIRRNQIVEAGEETLCVDRLIYPTPMSEHPWHFSPRSIEVLEQLASRVRTPSHGPERIYVSRNAMPQRRPLNEAAVIDAVRARGFTVVSPETMSFTQQIAAFRNARLVVGSYGAALTNAVFASGDLTLFALTSAYMQDDFFSTLMSLKGARYLSLHGPASEPSRDCNADFTIDLARFETLLDRLLRSW